MSDKNKLTQRQNKFVNLYFEEKSALQAALKAGYGGKSKTLKKRKQSANHYVNQLMKHEGIKKEIERKRKDLEKASKWSREKMIKELDDNYKKAKERNNPKDALPFLQEISKILGYYEAEKHDIRQFVEKLEIKPFNDEEDNKSN